VVTFNGRRDTPRYMQQGIEVGLREELAEHLQALLPTPHPSQPIMHQRDFHLSYLDAITRDVYNTTLLYWQHNIDSASVLSTKIPTVKILYAWIAKPSLIGWHEDGRVSCNERA
jgi:hypothetical protein